MTDASDVDRRVLCAVNEDAAAFYRRQLLGADACGPRHYLTDRGFGSLFDDTIWTVGYAPASWTALHDHLASLGYDDPTMIAAGLVSISRRGTPIDRFRDRITFGIRNRDNDLVGFTARSAPGAPANAPKYLNTPRTSLYSKSEVLFGLGETSRCEPDATTVLVEGPFDAIAISLSEPGRQLAPLALCGTALSSRHVDLLGKLSKSPIVVALDNDAAGRRATRDAYFALKDIGRDLKAVHPSADDPAQLLARSGLSAVRHQFTDPIPLADRIIDDHVATWPDIADNTEAKICCLRSAAELICRMDSSDVARQITRVTRALDVDPSAGTAELHRAVGRAYRARRSGDCCRHSWPPMPPDARLAKHR